MDGRRLPIARNATGISAPYGSSPSPARTLGCNRSIKDWGGGPQWHGLHRTVLLGDGSKVTMEARGPLAVTQWTAIYDGDSHVQFDNCRNQISWQGNDYAETGQLERTQYDGETTAFETNTTTGVATYNTVYNEDENFERVATPGIFASIASTCSATACVRDRLADCGMTMATIA